MKCVLIIISIIIFNREFIKAQVSLTFDDFADFQIRYKKQYTSVSEQYKR